MGGRRILSDPQLEEMAALREKGWGIDRIAAHFTAAGTPITGSAICWQCLRLGADAPSRLRRNCPSAMSLRPYRRNGRLVRPYSSEEDEVLRMLDRQGARYSEMAQRLGRRENSIRGRLLTLARHEARAEDKAVAHG